MLPDGWNAQKAAAHLEKHSWLPIGDDGALFCSTCSELHSLGVEVEERVEWEPWWKELGAGVRSSGDNLRTKKSSLRNKMNSHNDSRAHQSAFSILDKRNEEAWRLAPTKLSTMTIVVLRRYSDLCTFFRSKTVPFLIIPIYVCSTTQCC